MTDWQSQPPFLCFHLTTKWTVYNDNNDPWGDFQIFQMRQQVMRMHGFDGSPAEVSRLIRWSDIIWRFGGFISLIWMLKAQDFFLSSAVNEKSILTLKSQQSGQGQKRQHRLWWVLGDGLEASQVSLWHPQFFCLWFPRKNYDIIFHTVGWLPRFFLLWFPRHNIPHCFYLQVNTRFCWYVSRGKSNILILGAGASQFSDYSPTWPTSHPCLEIYLYAMCMKFKVWIPPMEERGRNPEDRGECFLWKNRHGAFRGGNEIMSTCLLKMHS